DAVGPADLVASPALGDAAAVGDAWAGGDAQIGVEAAATRAGSQDSRQRGQSCSKKRRWVRHRLTRTRLLKIRRLANRACPERSSSAPFRRQHGATMANHA